MIAKKIEHKNSRSRKNVTDAKVSERYDEHQSSTLLGDTKSTQSGGLVEGENSEDDEDGRRRQEMYQKKKKKKSAHL